MNCSVKSKIRLILAGFDSYSNPAFKRPAQRELGESLFWLCDGLEDDLKSSPNPVTKDCMNHLAIIKHFANEMVKYHLSDTQIVEAVGECGKLIICTAVERHE